MWHSLYYVWRLVATGASLVLFGIGGLLISFVVFPFTALTSHDASQRADRIQRSIHRMFRFYTWLLSALHLIKVKTEGAERLQSCQGCLIISNHPSLLDVVVIMSLMQKSQCIVKNSLWNSPFVGGVMRAANYIRNDQDPDLLVEKCAQFLSEGQNIILFPEGTRTKHGQPLKFKRGAANIALAAQSQIQFVTIKMSPTALTKDEPWYRIAPSRVKINVSVGEKLDISSFLGQESRSRSVRTLTRRLEEHYVA